MRVAALEWGRDAAERVATAAAQSGDEDLVVRPCPAADPQEPGFDLVVATDVMYVHEAVPPLVDTLQVRTAGCRCCRLRSLRPTWHH